ncbi:MAG: substrate-binding domain-containing protein [Treponema sp.]|nr:substrate-binding domain-containing protein [Treponema sp.]
MEKKTARLIKYVFLIFSFIALLVFSIVFYAVFFSSRARIQNQNEYNPSDNCLYHIIVTGTYENQSFLKEVYEGASRASAYFNSVIDLHIPQSQADTESLQNLLDYCSYLNADGIIVYVDSPDFKPNILTRSDSPSIPIITIGHFSPNFPQISFIGINNWELGKKLADETQDTLPNGGTVYIINDTNTQNANNLISSIQSALQNNSLITSKVIEEISPALSLNGQNNIFISITEDDTIRSAQLLSEQFDMDKYKFIGFGGNEVCQLYLQKGWITKLVSLDPQKIGQDALYELFEYRSKGNANSYISADVKISNAKR